MRMPRWRSEASAVGVLTLNKERRRNKANKVGKRKKKKKKFRVGGSFFQKNKI